MSKVEVKLLYFLNNLTTQEYVLSLNDDCTLQEISAYLYSEWKVLRQPHALYSLSHVQPVVIPESKTIRELAKGASHLTLHLTEQENLKGGNASKKCCLLF